MELNWNFQRGREVLRKIQWGRYGYFLELHNVYNHKGAETGQYTDWKSSYGILYNSTLCHIKATLFIWAGLFDRQLAPTQG